MDFIYLVLPLRGVFHAIVLRFPCCVSFYLCQYLFLYVYVSLSLSLSVFFAQILTANFTAISIDFVLILCVDFLFVQVMLIVVSTLAGSVDIIVVDVVVFPDICSLICLIIARSVRCTLSHVCGPIQIALPYFPND